MTVAIVTGASGFVGSHLVDCLLERDYRVKVVVRRTSDLRWLEGRPVDRLEADLRRPVALPPCDVFFHVAGVVRARSAGDYMAGNRDAARNAIEGARAARFVHVSSLAAVGPGREVDETTPCRPVSVYGRSKLEGELEVWRRRDRIPVTVIRPPVVYGPRDPALLSLYRAVRWGVRPEVGRGMVLSLIHVRDLVEGIARAAESPAAAGEAFFISDPRPVAMSEVLEVISRAIGGRSVRVRLPARVVRFLGAAVEDLCGFAGFRPAFNRDKALEMTQEAWCCSPAKAKRILGWETRIPMARGMAETLEWYRSHGLLRGVSTGY